LIACCALFPRLAHAGALQEVEDAASKRSDDDDDDDDDDRSRGSGGYVHHASSGPNYGAMGEQGGDRPTVLEHIFLFPWTVPRLLIDDPCLVGYARYPYDAGFGQLRRAPIAPECALDPAAPAEPRKFAMQTDFEAGYMLRDIVAGTFAARVQMPHRLELAGRISFMEDLKARPHEQALMGTVLLNLRFAQSARVDFRTGAGLRAFGLHKPLLGIDLFYAMDLYARKPLVVHLELHAGSLARAFAAQARAAIGVQIWKLELYAGYDHTVVYGSTTARLGGPVLGVRAWF
jgi:hypothetical protein